MLTPWTRSDAVVDPPLTPDRGLRRARRREHRRPGQPRGSIDWLCLPTFDSAACFAALLGTPGQRALAAQPGRPRRGDARSYVGDSFVLETTYETATGRQSRVTDLMPLGDGRADLCAASRALEGTVRVRHEWTVRFDYGRDAPVGAGTSTTAATATRSSRRSPAPTCSCCAAPGSPTPSEGHHVDEFDVAAGETFSFSTTWFRRYDPIPPPLPIAGRHPRDDRAERGVGRAAATTRAPTPKAVTRSLLVLRVLTHPKTGGIVAAPTTSPARGLRRRAQLGLPLLLAARRRADARGAARLGYLEEAALWRNWLLRAVAGDPAGHADHVPRRRRT